MYCNQEDGTGTCFSEEIVIDNIQQQKQQCHHIIILVIWVGALESVPSDTFIWVSQSRRGTGMWRKQWKQQCHHVVFVVIWVGAPTMCQAVPLYGLALHLLDMVLAMCVHSLHCELYHALVHKNTPTRTVTRMTIKGPPVDTDTVKGVSWLILPCMPRDDEAWLLWHHCFVRCWTDQSGLASMGEEVCGMTNDNLKKQWLAIVMGALDP